MKASASKRAPTSNTPFTDLLRRMSLLLLLLLFTYSTASPRYFQGIELLSDVNYTQGFEVIPACPSDPTICSKAPRYHLHNPFSPVANQSAAFQIVQWASHSNLSTDGVFVHDNRSRGMQWATEDKRFILFEDPRLQLAVNGFHEYAGKYKARDAPWVHLLVQQDIGIAGVAVRLSEVTELRWNLDVQLLYMDQHIQPGYDPGLHAAIFPLYMTIQNLVPGDSEYGKYFWLGIGLYDDRVEMSPLYVNGDAGTGSLIYSPAFANFATTSVHSGKIVHVSGDMMPFVRLGLQAANDRGFLHSNDLSRYFVGGVNIGWEVTGLNNGTIEVGNLSLKQYTARNPKSYEFDRDRDTQGWTRLLDLNQLTDGPLNGKWILKPFGDDPQLLSPPVRIDASVVKRIIIHMANDHLSDNHFQLFWSTGSEGVFNESKSIWIEMKSDGGWRDYVLNLSTHSHWHGIIRRLRIDPVQYGSAGSFGLDYIRFAPWNQIRLVINSNQLNSDVAGDSRCSGRGNISLFHTSVDQWRRQFRFESFPDQSSEFEDVTVLQWAVNRTAMENSFIIEFNQPCFPRPRLFAHWNGSVVDYQVSLHTHGCLSFEIGILSFVRERLQSPNGNRRLFWRPLILMILIGNTFFYPSCWLSCE